MCRPVTWPPTLQKSGSMFQSGLAQQGAARWARGLTGTQHSAWADDEEFYQAMRSDGLPGMLMGRVMVKVVPWPTTLSTVIWPWCILMMP